MGKDGERRHVQSIFWQARVRLSRVLTFLVDDRDEETPRAVELEGMPDIAIDIRCIRVSVQNRR